MIQEQKAKRYDDAIKLIKDNLNTLNEIAETGAEVISIQSIKNCFYKAFPELCESEDEKIRKFLIKWVQDNYYHGTTEISTKTLIAWLEKQGEQKPIDNDMVEALRTEYEKGRADVIAEMQKPWGEDDEEFFNDTITFLEKSKNALDHIDWLKLLKDRVQLQPKQEWSEGDDYNSLLILSTISQDQDLSLETKNKLSSWLKSIKERYTWKPSDDQMYYLSWIANVKLGDGIVEQEVSKRLNSLYDDLKKLKE